MLAIAPAVLMPARAIAAPVCSPGAGKDGSPGTLAGVYNTYYYPTSSLTLSAGATTIDLSNFTLDSTRSGDSTTPIGLNDEILIIQMQDGSINYTNSSAYGSGGTSGSGYTSVGNAGKYEYAAVTAVAGTVLTIKSTGAGNGLINTYTKAAKSGTNGQKTFQIVRVPQYITATLSSTFRASYWDGNTGGVAVLDMASTLNLGGASVYATGDGFRGGALSYATTSPAAVLNTDYVDSAQMNGAGTQPAFGTKGEGVSGTPGAVFYYNNFTTPSAPTGPTLSSTPGTNPDGYPGGDQGMGAPGNAGGGGTDDDPAANDQNTGGGGGGNGGAGGKGGYPWTPSYSGNTSLYALPGVHTAPGTGGYSAANSGDIGGRGGSTVPQAVGRAIMGGGGGGGSNNNHSENNTYNADGSSGGVGGGIVLLRLADVSGSAATIYANGTTGLAPDNDGGGGGGAGGTVVITSPSSFTGITVHADGAAGTTAAALSGDTYPTVQHGPGGGGGGGVVLTTSAVTSTVAGGAAGTTTPNTTTYGATAGASGYSSIVSYGSVPGVASGAECYSGSTSGTLGTGPVGSYNATGSFDGNVTANDNNDFTAVEALPLNASLSNTGTVPGTPIGNTLAAFGPINVENDFRDNNSANNKAVDVTLTATAPQSPSGWTVQICPDNGGSPSCWATGNWTSVGTAGATATSVYHVAKNTDTGVVHYWAVYNAPAGTVAYTRYDGAISANDGTNSNATHNELYTGFVPLTKTVSISTPSKCKSSVSPPTNGVCPGDVLTYTIDYRNIVVGAASESALTAAWPKTAAGSLVITEPGTGSGSTWPSFSNGLKELLVAGANGTTTFGDSIANSVFTGNSVGSLSFTDKVGGTTFQLMPCGIATCQGTLTFRVVIK